MDKLFLLIYVRKGRDGCYHAYPAWFQTEKELEKFLQKERRKNRELEIDLALEIYRYRELNVTGK